MSEETKQKLLAQVRFDSMMEDMAYMVGHYHNLNEEEVLGLLDSLCENNDLEDFFYNCFKEQFKRKDAIEKFIEYDEKGKEAVETFMDFIDSKMVVELNKILPEDKRIPEEIVH